MTIANSLLVFESQSRRVDRLNDMPEPTVERFHNPEDRFPLANISPGDKVGSCTMFCHIFLSRFLMLLPKQFSGQIISITE